ncbi:MAG: glycosyltransferase, partial [Proteobacteria bacterium]|nr:glycosyltransferase [Pseudomonadota bacterium]
FLIRLVRVLRLESPKVIYSFLGVSNILAVVMRPAFKSGRIIWSIRASNMDLKQYDRLSRWNYWLECRLARFSDLIIANSHAGMKFAVENGFPKEKITIIPNGIDTKHFDIDEATDNALREKWGIAGDERIIGVVGRIDPMKGIPIFLKAATIIRKHNLQVRFVWVGMGEISYEKSMHQLASELGLDDLLIWAGPHADMVAVYNAFDIASSTSCYGEGFPNVLGEAMACGVPCVVTDVGDSAVVVGDTGMVVAPQDSKALADAWIKILSLNGTQLEKKALDARNRVVSKFSVGTLIKDTEKLLTDDPS